MNSTERLLACLRGRVADRVPISTYELVGWNDRAWENREPSYAGLMGLIRDKTDCLYMTGVSVLNPCAAEHEVVTQTWDQGDQHVTRRSVRTPTRTLTTVTSFADNVHTTWTREHPVKDLADLAAYLDLPWACGEPDFTELNRAWADLGGTRGLPMLSVGDPICDLAEAFEFGNFTVHAITETDAIAKALDRIHERCCQRLAKTLTGPVANVVFRICGPEYATPPYLPPRLFDRFVAGYVAEYVQMIRRAGGIARLHCHGKIGRVVDQIARIGPDALDPIEPPPDGDISIADLKRTIGDRVCLIGGIELKHLENESEEFIEKLVRDTMAAGKPGGRFIIMPTAAPINVSLSPRTEANYRRFIETALETGTY